MRYCQAACAIVRTVQMISASNITITVEHVHENYAKALMYMTSVPLGFAEWQTEDWNSNRQMRAAVKEGVAT